jgi:hypothetical protein
VTFRTGPDGYGSGPDEQVCFRTVYSLPVIAQERIVVRKDSKMPADLYELDHSAWLEEQTRLLRKRELNRLDVEHLIEELTVIMGNEKRELYRRLRVLTAHLLKWQFQPEKRSSSWKGTIRTQRNDILDLLKESPSLKRLVEQKVADAYPEARELASDETGLLEDNFPRLCPYTYTEILDRNFWPD